MNVAMSAATDVATLPGPQGRLGPSLHRAAARLEDSSFRWQHLGHVAVPIIATLLRVASQPSSAAAYVVIAGWALLGRRQAVVALFLCWLFNMINHAFCGPPLMAAVLRWLVVLCAALSVFGRGPSAQSTTRPRSLIAFTVGILAIIAVHCFVVSPALDVSLLKVIVFSMAFLTALCGWAWMSPADRHLATQTIFGGLFLIVVLSLPMAFVPAGYLRRSRLFCGVLAHSQELGVMAAVTASILATQCATLRPLRWWRVVVLAIVLIELYWTKARVGMLSFVLGMGVAVAYEMAHSAIVTSKANPRLIAGRMALAAVALGLLLVFYGGAINAAVGDFLRKGDQSEGDVSVVEAGMKSRGFKIEEMWKNIDRHPLEGIGFGISSDPDGSRFIVRDAVLGLPVMAAVEKGVLPVMIVEELGIPIAVLVFLWFAALGLSATRGGILPVAVLSTALFSNLAEASFLSAGGAGLLLIILVCWAATEPAGGVWKQHLRARQAAISRSGPRGAPLSPLTPAPPPPFLPPRVGLPAPLPAQGARG